MESTTNAITGQILATIVETLEYVYKAEKALGANTMKMEIVYQATGILKEVAQGLRGGNYSQRYIHEKCVTIYRVLENDQKVDP